MELPAILVNASVISFGLLVVFCVVKLNDIIRMNREAVYIIEEQRKRLLEKHKEINDIYSGITHHILDQIEQAEPIADSAALQDLIVDSPEERAEKITNTVQTVMKLSNVEVSQDTLAKLQKALVTTGVAQQNIERVSVWPTFDKEEKR